MRVFAYIFLLLLLAACTQETPEPEAPQTPAVNAAGEFSYELRDFDQTFFESKPYSIRIVLGHVTLKGDSVMQRVILDEGIQVQIMKQGDEICSIRANKALVLLPLAEVDLLGGILIKTAEKYELEAENLHWRLKGKEISTGGFVKIISPESIIYGDSLVANLDFSYYKIMSVRGAIQLDE